MNIVLILLEDSLFMSQSSDNVPVCHCIRGQLINTILDKNEYKLNMHLSEVSMNFALGFNTVVLIFGNYYYSKPTCCEA